MSQIKDAIKDGTNFGRKKFNANSSFPQSAMVSNLEEDQASLLDSSGSSSSDDDDEDLVIHQMADSDEHPETRKCRLLNSGKSRNVNQCRTWRVKPVGGEKLTLKNNCKVDDETGKMYKIGDKGRFYARKLHIALMVGDRFKSAEESSTSYRPISEFCSKHSTSTFFFCVKSCNALHLLYL